MICRELFKKKKQKKKEQNWSSKQLKKNNILKLKFVDKDLILNNQNLELLLSHKCYNLAKDLGHLNKKKICGEKNMTRFRWNKEIKNIKLKEKKKILMIREELLKSILRSKLENLSLNFN